MNLHRCFDPRTRDCIGNLNIGTQLDQVYNAEENDSSSRGHAITSTAFASDGLHFVVGTHSGHVVQYDLRSRRPLLHKHHQYELPVHSLAYHSTRDANLVMSVDSKVVKMWSRHTGEAFCNIETVAPSTDLAMNPGSGMMFIAGQQERVMCYYVPALGPAPKWCHYLDNITEELEIQV